MAGNHTRSEICTDSAEPKQAWAQVAHDFADSFVWDSLISGIDPRPSSLVVDALSMVLAGVLNFHGVECLRTVAGQMG